MRLFFFSLFLFNVLAAAENEPQITPIPTELSDNAIPSLVNITSLPSAVVAGCVNVISGDYFEQEVIDKVSGPDGYELGHSYYSSSLDEGTLADGWNFLHFHKLEVYSPTRIKYLQERCTNSSCTHFLLPRNISIERYEREEHSHPGAAPLDPLFLSIFSPSGGRLVFKTEFDINRKEKSIRHLSLVTKKTGHTNVSGEEISAKTNICNTSLYWNKDDNSFTVTYGDGLKRVYEYEEKGHHQTKFTNYRLHKEILPSGNIRIYHYNEKKEITEIKGYTKNLSHKLYSISFDQKSGGAFSKHPSLHITTSDKKNHTYYFKKLSSDGTWAISGVKKDNMPYIRYIYSEKSPRHARRVIRKEQADGYYLDISYYRPAENKVGSEKITPKSKKEKKFLANRVKTLTEPAGPSGEKIITHRFFYYDDKNGKGHAKVLDTYNNATRYYWDENKRLIEVKKHDVAKNLLLRERYIWGKEKSRDAGRILRHILFDEKNTPKLCRYYTYDDRGNVVKETLYSGAVEVKNDEVVKNSGDKKTIYRTFSNDEFNLLLSISDSAGNYTYYDYYEGTNLVKATYLCDKKTIKKRTFFSYDDAGIVTKEIVDDGSEKDKKSLKDVTERHIRKTKPRYSRPHFGDAEEIADYYYDFVDKKEVLLSKTVNTFSEKGFVETKSVIDQENNTYKTLYHHNEHGKITYIRDPIGNERFFCYDDLNRVIEEKGPGLKSKKTYTYDLLSRVISESDEHLHGPLLTTRYTYDALGRKIEITDPQNNKTFFTYDALGRPLTIFYPEIFDEEGKEVKTTKHFQYESLATKITITDERGDTTIVKKNALGQITRCIYPDTTKSDFTYDTRSNLIEERYPNLATTKKKYDYQNRLIETTLEYDGTVLSTTTAHYNSFHLLETTHPNGLRSIYQYDNAGKKIAEIERGESDRITEFFYDGKGRIVKEEKKVGSEVSGKAFSYNDIDQCITATTYDSYNPFLGYTYFQYDTEGNLIQKIVNIDGKESIESYSYFPQSVIKESTNPFGQTTYYFYNYFYTNSHGQKVVAKETINPQGVITRQIFDAKQNLSVECTIDPIGRCIAKKELFYGVENKPQTIWEYVIANTKTEKIITTKFHYGPMGRIEKEIEAFATPEQKTTEYFYNSLGQKETMLLNDGTFLEYLYDTKGRLSRYFSSDNTVDYRYFYDQSDNVVEIENNRLHRSTKRSFNLFSDLISETFENEQKIVYSYDSLSRITNVTLPDSSTIAYEYLPTSLKKVSRIKDERLLYYHEILSRDFSGNIQKVQTGNGIQAEYHYDLLGRLSEISHPLFTQSIAEIDKVANISSIRGSDPKGSYEHYFAYNNQSQLIKENDTFYEYDSLFNRIDSSYTINSLHELLSDGSTEYEYDKRANLTTINQKKTYTYDALNRLSEVIQDDCQYIYHYDGCNRRVQKEIITPNSHDVIDYLYMGENEIGAMQDDTIFQLRVLAETTKAELGASVAIELHDAVYIPVHDLQYNVSLLADMKQNVIETLRFDAFGKSDDLSVVDNPWQYKSKRVDSETGFVFFGRRYYMPDLGRFISQDPLGLEQGPNLFAYALNNPLTTFDLYGLEAINQQEATTPIEQAPSLLEQAWNTIVDIGCRILETIVHNLPHFGSYNDRVEDWFRSCRGAEPKIRPPAGVINISKGETTAKGCESLIYYNGLGCNFENAKENALYLASLFKNGPPAVNLAYSPSYGLCMDLFRGLMNAVGIRTSNVDILKNDVSTIIQNTSAGSFTLAIGHSNGGRVMELGKHQGVREQFKQVTIGSGGLIGSDCINYVCITDPIPLSDIVGCLTAIGRALCGNSNTVLCGHPFTIPVWQHRFQSSHYRQALTDVIKNLE